MDQTATGRLSDESLLSQFAQGDRCALEELASRYETALLGLARGLLNGNSDHAADAVQETWLRVIRYAASFRGQSSFKTWIYRIVINQCYNIRKKRTSIRSAEPSTLPAGRSTPANPESSLEPRFTEDEHQRLRDEVAHLAEDRRLLLLLCYHDGFTHQQAAEILEIPVGTLKSRLHAALNELRRRMPSEVRT
jgi:RNA polymerase sigma-70 factor, ECF subfamily